ncbi:AAA family ATPase, partial [candidate division TA06 bacterium]|nr:AAA family ATPase [candidate division TA06 bacterium]
MRLDRLELQNFRNFSNLTLEFHPKGNLFLGRNGAGKTNLLEGIYYLAMAKSFRGGDEELTQFGEDFFRIKGVGKGMGGDLHVGITAITNQGKEKRILRNGHSVIASEWVGTL